MWAADPDYNHDILKTANGIDLHFFYKKNLDEKYLKNYYKILKILRDNNINSEIFLDSKKNLGKQLTYANKKQCPVAVICGENEFKDNTITLKNLLGVKGENNQVTFPKENLINEIKKFT